MNLSNNWHKSSLVRIPVFAGLVYAYFCAPISLEHKEFVQPITASAPQNAAANAYDHQRDSDNELAATSEKTKRSNKNSFAGLRTHPSLNHARRIDTTRSRP